MFKKSLLIALLLLIIAAIYGWINRESWLVGFNQERTAKALQFKQNGAAFGRDNSQQDCLDRSLSQFDGCLGFSCTVNHGLFLKACLSEAAETPDFCKGVPEYHEKATEDDKSWVKYYCWDHDIRGEGCRLLMKQQQYFCSQK
ncbi:hypothetical protein [Neptunomonas antarctica]|uniref:Uncharacterized protein n=1 Tax=Neptunomonas antarctica TaxID=619304 RepID=A0A1N7IS72_9GAMM|nr:hypothetical protein [Neptunomonas antarctica]SIS39867.1 hypothetical protein SAMN05421760_10135 [Neptunomonas antarctica]